MPEYDADGVPGRLATTALEASDPARVERLVGKVLPLVRGKTKGPGEALWVLALAMAEILYSGGGPPHRELMTETAHVMLDRAVGYAAEGAQEARREG